MPEATATLALIREGLSFPDLASALTRASVGTFFAISGGNKLFNAQRHAAYCNTLRRLGIPCVGVMRWWVAGWSFVGGIMLTLGLLSAFAAGVLLIIMLVAIACEAHEKVEKFKPINGPDRCADYLYLPEVLYALILSAVILGGPGAFTLDNLLWG